MNNSEKIRDYVGSGSYPVSYKTAVSNSFSISTIQSFLEFEKEQKKIIRGNIKMYDIKGHHKYLTFAELFNWYVSR